MFTVVSFSFRSLVGRQVSILSGWMITHRRKKNLLLLGKYDLCASQTALILFFLLKSFDFSLPKFTATNAKIASECELTKRLVCAAHTRLICLSEAQSGYPSFCLPSAHPFSHLRVCPFVRPLISPSVCPSVSQPVSQSVLQSDGDSVRQSVSLSVRPSIRQSGSQSVSLSVCLSVFLVCQSVRPSVRLSIHQSVSQSVSQSGSQSVSQSVSQSACQSVCLSVCQSVSQSVRLSVCPSISQIVSQSVSQSVAYSLRQSITQEDWLFVICFCFFSLFDYLFYDIQRYIGGVCSVSQIKRRKRICCYLSHHAQDSSSCQRLTNPLTLCRRNSILLTRIVLHGNSAEGYILWQIREGKGNT